MRRILEVSGFEFEFRVWVVVVGDWRFTIRFTKSALQYSQARSCFHRDDCNACVPTVEKTTDGGGSAQSVAGNLFMPYL